MPIEDAGPGTRLRHRVVLPRGDLAARERRMEWCRHQLRGGDGGPRWVPPFMRSGGAGRPTWHDLHGEDREVWCFGSREDAVMFDMVWAP